MSDAYPRSMPLAEYAADAGMDTSLRACRDCGSAHFTITNRRVACLSCYQFTQNREVPHDRTTRLYANEIVIGHIYIDREEVILLRPTEPYAPPRRGRDESATMPPLPRAAFDARGCVRASSSSSPMPAEAAATRRQVERREADARRADEASRKSRRRPTRRTRFADEPALIDTRDYPAD